LFSKETDKLFLLRGVSVSGNVYTTANQDQLISFIFIPSSSGREGNKKWAPAQHFSPFYFFLVGSGHLRLFHTQRKGGLCHRLFVIIFFFSFLTKRTLSKSKSIPSHSPIKPPVLKMEEENDGLFSLLFVGSLGQS
jgi:hypothetical protein